MYLLNFLYSSLDRRHLSEDFGKSKELQVRKLGDVGSRFFLRKETKHKNDPDVKMNRVGVSFVNLK